MVSQRVSQYMSYIRVIVLQIKLNLRITAEVEGTDLDVMRLEKHNFFFFVCFDFWIIS